MNLSLAIGESGLILFWLLVSVVSSAAGWYFPALVRWLLRTVRRSDGRKDESS